MSIKPPRFLTALKLPQRGVHNPSLEWLYCSNSKLSNLTTARHRCQPTSPMKAIPGQQRQANCREHGVARPARIPDFHRLSGQVPRRILALGTDQPVATDCHDDVAMVFVCQPSRQGKRADVVTADGFRCFSPVRLDESDLAVFGPLSGSSGIDEDRHAGVTSTGAENSQQAPRAGAFAVVGDEQHVAK